MTFLDIQEEERRRHMSREEIRIKARTLRCEIINTQTKLNNLFTEAYELQNGKCPHPLLALRPDEHNETTCLDCGKIFKRATTGC